MNNNGAFDWNSEIVTDSSFVLLKPGIYEFKVMNFERAKFSGSDKMGPCPKAILKININNEATVSDNLFLHKKAEWKLSEFFRSIGLKKHGEPLVMDWGNIIGRTGKCEVEQYESKKDGNKYNQIKKYLDPEEQNTQQFTHQYKPPQF